MAATTTLALSSEIVASMATEAMRDLLFSSRHLFGGQVIHTSPGFAVKLRESLECGEFKYQVQDYSRPTLLGMDLIEHCEPLKKRVLRSCDTFAEYEESDADWAVPLGLAEWIEVDVDFIIEQAVRSAQNTLIERCRFQHCLENKLLQIWN